MKPERKKQRRGTKIRKIDLQNTKPGRKGTHMKFRLEHIVKRERKRKKSPTTATSKNCVSCNYTE